MEFVLHRGAPAPVWPNLAFASAHAVQPGSLSQIPLSFYNCLIAGVPGVHLIGGAESHET